MLFLINWSVSSENRVACWNVFGKMTPEDDLKDAGEHIKIHGRWHQLSGAGGYCIAECSDASHLSSWMLNWSPICDISVIPVVEDSTARANIRTKPYFASDSKNKCCPDEGCSPEDCAENNCCPPQKDGSSCCDSSSADCC